MDDCSQPTSTAKTAFAASLFDGDLPTDWAIGVMGDVLSGTEYGLSEPGDPDGDTSIVGMRDLVDGVVRFEELATVDSGGNDWSKFRLRRGDILLNRTNSPDLVGKIGYVREDFDAVFASYLVRLHVDQRCADAEYVAAWLNSGIAQRALKRLSTRGVSQANINPTEFRKHCPIPLPSLPEQRKIAEILRTWDEALEKLTALRAAKKKVRDATLQTILNNPDWPERSLSELGTVASAGVDKKSVEGERPVRLLNFVDVLRRDFLYDAEFTHEVTAPERKASKCDVRKGDVFFTPSSETRDDIAHSAVAMETMPGVVYSYHVVRLRPTETIDLRFRAYLFKSRHFLRQAFALAAGSGQRYVLSQDQFRQMTVRLPDHEIQAKVSAYFAAVDREIALIDAEIEALTRQKRGLMQKLLTGEWRVKLEEPVA